MASKTNRSINDSLRAAAGRAPVQQQEERKPPETAGDLPNTLEDVLALPDSELEAVVTELEIAADEAGKASAQAALLVGAARARLAVLEGGEDDDQGGEDA